MLGTGNFGNWQYRELAMLGKGNDQEQEMFENRKVQGTGNVWEQAIVCTGNVLKEKYFYKRKCFLRKNI